MRKEAKCVFSISVCIMFVIAGSTIAYDGTDRDWYKLSPVQGTISEFDNMQPYTTLNYIIALQGIYPSRDAPLGGGGAGVASAEPYLGEIVLFAGNFAPRGWAFCDGQLLPISQNEALFSLLGTSYGGDGRTTFALPDLRGRVPMHAGTGPGLTPRLLGQKGGSETGQCDSASEFDNMQPYTTLNYIIALQGLYPPRDAPLGGEGAGVASVDPYLGEIVLFAGNFAPRSWAFCDGQLLSISQNSALFSLLGTTYGGDGRTTFALPDLRGRVPVHAGTGPGLTPRLLGQKGGSETGQCDSANEYDNMQPYTTLNYIIALQGLYPPRDAPLGGGGASVASAEPYLGEIVLFAGNFAPRSWAFCDGQLLSISQNSALFSLLGTTYGGDGRTTFALPDLRGRVPVHAGTGPGLTPRLLGQKGGSETGQCAPVVTIDSPTSAAYTTDTLTVTLSGDAAHYWYYIAGVDVTNQTWTTNQDRTLGDGMYTLHAFGNDSSGNIQHVSVSFIVDTVDPIVTISQPTSIIFTEDSVTLTYHISEPGSVSIFIDNVLSTSTNNNSVISGLINGVHNITIVITDNAGNSGSTTMIFEIDVQITTTTTTTSITSPEFPTNGWSILVLLLSIFSLLIWRKFRIQR